MRVIISLITLIIVSVTAVLLLLTPIRDEQKKQNFTPLEFTHMDTFTYTEHGFSVSYHTPYEIIENSPDSYTIGTMSGQTVIPLAELHVFTNQEKANLKKFATQQAHAICSLYSDDESFSCTDKTKIHQIITDTGIKGIELFMEYVSSDESQDPLTAGPFFALPLGDETVILLYSPPPYEEQHSTYSTVRVIAESIREIE